MSRKELNLEELLHPDVYKPAGFNLSVAYYDTHVNTKRDSLASKESNT